MIDLTLSTNLHVRGWNLLADRSEISHPDECQDCNSVEDLFLLVLAPGRLYRGVPADFRRMGRCRCWGGTATFPLHEDGGFQPVLVEPSLNAVPCPGTGLVPLVCSMEDAGWRNRFPRPSFDVMEHIEDDRGSRSTRWLFAPENRLYLTVPAYRFCGRATTDGGPLSPLSYARTFVRRGLPRWSLNCLFSPLPLPIWLCRSLPQRLGMTRPGHERFAKEHSSGRGWLSRGLEAFLRWEQRRLKQGRRIPFGSSCLIVARKVLRSDSDEIVPVTKQRAA
jgi:hypothetical protein